METLYYRGENSPTRHLMLPYKTSELVMGYILLSCWSKEPCSGSKISQIIGKAIGYAS